MASAFGAGERLGHYEIVALLGQGGMGRVFRAIDRRLDRPVAIKVLAPHLLASQEARERFEREARAISALSHPNVAVLYDVGFHDGEPYMVLEYLPGGSLQQRVQGRRLPWPEISLFAGQAGRALAHAHDRGVIHRDVKPGNALFSGEDVLKLVDFGLSRFRGDRYVTAAGERRGTALYMAPEQASGAAVDHRADIFSFGVMLYEFGAGRSPFEAEHTDAIIYRVLHTEPQPLEELRPDLPAGFGRAVARAMAKAPEDRFPDMRELLRELRLHVTSSTAHIGPAATQTMPLTAARRSARRRRWFLGGVAAAGAGAVMLAGRQTLRRWLGWPAVPAQKHLVVLPFDNVGGGAADQAFCDGLAEVLSSTLSEMERFQGSLLVTPASEIRSQRIRSVREARRAFGVNLALTGSVQRRDGEVILTANLVDARTERQIRSFVEQVRDASHLQERVAGRVAGLLELELQPQIRSSLEKSRTGAPGAYELCMQAYGYVSRSTAEDTERAIQLFQSALERDRNYALAHAGLGQAYWSRYRLSRDPQWLARAGEACQRAAALNERLSAVHVTTGLVQSATGHYDTAVKEFERALELDPVNVEAVRYLAGSLQGMGRSDAAEAAYRRAIALRPDYWAGYNALGGFYFAAGRLAEAEQAYRSLIRVTPENYRGYLNLGAVYFRWGKYGEAEKMFRRSLELEETDTAFSNLGTIYYYQGRYREALPMMQKAAGMPRGATNPVVWGNLGEAYAQCGEEEKAREAWQRAVEIAEQQSAINPRSAELVASAALYQAMLGRTAEAVERIGQARRMAPQNGGVLFKAVRIYERAGRRAAAVEALREALKAGATPDDFEREPDLKHLRADPHYTDAITRHKRASAR